MSNCVGETLGYVNTAVVLSDCFLEVVKNVDVLRTIKNHV